MPETTSNDVLDILLVDDSPTYRMILSRAVKGWPMANLVGTAGDGEAGLLAIAEKKPQLVLLDVSMPILDGIETLKRIRARWTDVDVVMCSGVDADQTGLTMHALSLGALDFIAKPQGDNPSESFASLSASLHPLLELALVRKRTRLARQAGARHSPSSASFEPPPPSPPFRAPFRSRLGPAPSAPEEGDSTPSTTAPAAPAARSVASSFRESAKAPRGLPPLPSPRTPPHPVPAIAATARRFPSNVELLVIGVSTGGPNALQILVPKLPGDLPFPVLCVQHMPPLFTASLAERLDRASPLKVVEGADGQRVERGAMYIAPGGKHMTVVRGADGRIALRMTDTPPVNSCRPAVDVLFGSVEGVVGGNVVSLVLTGMGADGAAGVKALRSRGAWSIVQDESTSVVWGMPGAVAQSGQADEILPLERIADRIVEIARRGGGR